MPARGEMQTLALALAVALERPRSWLLAAASAAVMFLLLVWNGQMLQRYPDSGWEFHAEPSILLAVALLSALFGLLVPLEVAAISRARGAAGAAGSTVGTLFGLLGV